MSCPSVEELAALYDGLLPANRARPLRRHLGACPRCSQDFKNIDTLLALKSTPPPVALRRRVMQSGSTSRGRRLSVKPRRRERGTTRQPM